MTPMRFLAVLALCAMSTLAAERSIASCDLCSVYEIEAVYESLGVDPPWAKNKVSLGVAEQYTDFGTLRRNGREIADEAGQYLHSSITQFILGYDPSPRYGVQLNLPYIVRSYRRTVGMESESGTVKGVGDATLLANVRLLKLRGDDSVLVLRTAAGLELPTGDTSRLKDDGMAGAMGDMGVHDHGLALGSGSWDGVLGAAALGRRHDAFFTASASYALRTEGAHDYRFADAFTWSVKPGYFLIRDDSGALGILFAATGEAKGKDRRDGAAVEGSAHTRIFLGPELLWNRASGTDLNLGVDFPVLNWENETQLTPDWRIRASFSWTF